MWGSVPTKEHIDEASCACPSMPIGDEGWMNVFWANIKACENDPIYS